MCAPHQQASSDSPPVLLDHLCWGPVPEGLLASLGHAREMRSLRIEGVAPAHRLRMTSLQRMPCLTGFSLWLHPPIQCSTAAPHAGTQSNSFIQPRAAPSMLANPDQGINDATHARQPHVVGSHSNR